MAFITGHAKAKRIKLRDSVFPQSNGSVYEPSKGWRQVPRTLSLVMTLISQLAPKGKQDGAARVYLELWLRDMGEGLVELADPETHAYAAGYTTPGRAARSWRECMEVLKGLGFIKIAPKGSREYGYVLIVDPNKVVKDLRARKKIDDSWYNEYQQRMIQTGAA